jgi:hypothetical protein
MNGTNHDIPFVIMSVLGSPVPMHLIKKHSSVLDIGEKGSECSDTSRDVAGGKLSTISSKTR